MKTKIKLSIFTKRLLVISAVLVCVPVAVSAESILLSAGDFAVLGGTAISSTATVGTNIMSGNVGLSEELTTAITGFGPAVVTGGGAIIETGTITSQARLDFMKAATGLAAMPSNANLTGIELGGMTLSPGVYTFDSTAALTGTLTLDAQGQNNAFWVFQIGTALTTAAGSSVTVTDFGTNGGSDIGIFWNVGSAITIGADNQIEGNYLAATSITIGNGTHGNGRALALTTIALDNNQINSMGAPNSGDWTGGLVYDLNDNIVAVPEPAAFASQQARRSK
jgi:hypothetical protein